jgi:type IV fimbrial biogenesis protein FimT
MLGGNVTKMKTFGIQEKKSSRENNAASARLPQVGLTAIEVLIAFSVFAVVLLIAAPNVSSLVQNQYVKNTGSDLYTGLSLAKLEAEQRHGTVRMCPSSDGKSCRVDGDWNKGWLVFTDGNANGVPDDIELIQAFSAPSQKVRIVASGALTDTASFTVAGLSRNNESDTGSFKICHADSGSSHRKVTVDQDGWAEVTRIDSPCSDG